MIARSDIVGKTRQITNFESVPIFEYVDELGRYKEAYQELEQEAMVRFLSCIQLRVIS